MNRLPSKVYSQTDVDNARTKGQLIGWIQAAAVGIGGWFVLGLIGWIPTLVVVAVVGVIGVKLLSGKKG